MVRKWAALAGVATLVPLAQSFLVSGSGVALTLGKEAGKLDTRRAHNIVGVRGGVSWSLEMIRCVG